MTDGRADRRAAEILERALSRTHGTVTEFLETTTGEAVDAQLIVQTASVATDRNLLDVAAGHPLVSRQAILRGRTSARAYLYAETLLVPDRLPPAVTRTLATTTDPIGRVLAARGISVSRTLLGAPRRSPGVAAVGPDRCRDAAIYARRYRIESGAAIVMLIDEWFLPDLRDAVLRTG